MLPLVQWISKVMSVPVIRPAGHVVELAHSPERTLVVGRCEVEVDHVPVGLGHGPAADELTQTREPLLGVGEPWLIAEPGEDRNGLVDGHLKMHA